MSDLDGGTLRQIVIDGEPSWLLCCPGCLAWAEVDDDQLHGRVSTECAGGRYPSGAVRVGGCGFHETRDWARELGVDQP